MKFTPIRISLIYFLVALLWITMSDFFVDLWIDDSNLLSVLQTIKGFLFVSMTAIMLYGMIKSYERYIGKNNRELENQKKRLDIALNAANMAIWEYNAAEDTYISSEKHNAMFGYPKSEHLNLQKVLNRVYYKDIKEFEGKVDISRKEGKTFDHQYRIQFPSGKIRWYWTKAELTSASDLNSFSGVTMDITKRMELETELQIERERLRKLFNSIPVLINIYNSEREVISINAYHEEILGWTQEDIDQSSLLELCYPDPSYRKKVISDIIKQKRGWSEYRVETKNGENRLQMWTNIQLSDDTFVGVGYDVTEQRKLENQIKEERKQLRLIFDNMPLFINLHDKNHNIADVNHYFEERIGYSNEYLQKNNILELITTEKNYEKARLAIEQSDGDWNDFELVTRSGEKLYTTWTNIQLSEDRSLGIGLDITERIALEKSIEESRERLKITTKSANIGLWEWNPQTGEVYFDEIWASLVGYTLEELEPASIETWNKLVHPDDLKHFEETVEKYFNDETDTYECEVRMRHKDGTWVWILDRGKITEWDEEGKPAKMAGTHVDITDRVQAEEENKMLANVYRYSNTALGVSNHKTGKMVRVNSSFAELLGYDIDELVGIDVSDFYAPGFRQEMERVIKELTDYKQTIFETSLQKKNGEVFQALVNLALVTDAANKTEYRLSTVQDISYIKKQQAEIQRSRDRLLQAQEIAKLGYWTLRIEDNTLWWSEIVYDIYGNQINEYRPTIKNYLKFTHPDDRETVRNVLRNELLNKQFELIHRIVRDGETGYVQLRGERFYDENEKAWMINGIVLDITEIKRIEKQLETEQKRFQVAANITSDVIWEWDPEKNQLWWGEGIETLFGYHESDYKNDPRFWHKQIAEEDRERIIKSMENAEINGDLFWNEEYSFLDANNRKKRVADSAMLIRNKDGNINRIIGAMVDKTKEIEYQKSLEHQIRKFEMIAKSSNDVLYEWNCKTGEIWWSDGWLTKFMLEESQIEPTYDWWKSRLHPDYREKTVKTLEEAIADKKDSWHEYYKFKNGKGSYSIVIDKGYFIKDEGEVTYMVGTISDITEEVNAREELKASEEQYRLLFEQNPIPMWIYDPETLRFVTVNRAALKKYGYTKEEMLDKTIAEIRPESDIGRLKADLKKNLGKERTEFEEWVHLTKSGKKLIVEISASNIFYKRKQRRLVIAHDITEQRKAEEKAISAIIEGEERERQRIAKELHDGLGQYLSAANMNLKSVYEDVTGIPEKLDKSFKTGLELLNHAISETRNISQNLLPKAIQDYGLELAVESLINNLKSNNNIEFTLYNSISEVNIPSNIQINIYRILQEAVNNAIRHGKPDKVDIQLVYSDNEILLVIEDNGIGFNIHKIKGEGLGLRSMKTRAGAMSAEIDIVSTKEKGTIISVIVPI